MNIILYVNSFIPDIGGREIVVHYLARELNRLGHRARVMGTAGFIRHRKLKFEYPVHRWPTLRRLFKEQVSLLNLTLDSLIWGADIIHAHSTYPGGYIVSLLNKRRSKIPLVITPHGEDIHIVPEIGFGHRLDPDKRWKIECALDEADCVTAISDSIESSLLDAGCQKEKIEKIPNGIDFERFNSNDIPDIFHWLKIDKGSRLILSVGNYHPRKGHEISIKAMPDVLKIEPKAKLVIVGRDSFKLKKLIEELKLGENVILTGPIKFPLTDIKKSRSDNNREKDWLAALYCRSCVYLSSSIDEGAEGLSLSLMDAMAAGLPVIASRISGNKDIVEHGNNGLLIPPGEAKKLSEAIIDVLNSKEKARSMGKNGKEIVMKYHWREIAKKYVDTYEKAIMLSKKRGLKS